MVMKKCSVECANVISPVDVDIDDESVLADGMIPDSRIVKLIDELVTNDDFSRELYADIYPNKIRYSSACFFIATVIVQCLYQIDF